MKKKYFQFLFIFWQKVVNRLVNKKKEKNPDDSLSVRKLRLIKNVCMILSFEYKLKHMFKNKPKWQKLKFYDRYNHLPDSSLIRVDLHLGDHVDLLQR